MCTEFIFQLCSEPGFWWGVGAVFNVEEAQNTQGMHTSAVACDEGYCRESIRFFTIGLKPLT